MYCDTYEMDRYLHSLCEQKKTLDKYINKLNKASSDEGLGKLLGLYNISKVGVSTYEFICCQIEFKVVDCIKSGKLERSLIFYIRGFFDSTNPKTFVSFSIVHDEMVRIIINDIDTYVSQTYKNPTFEGVSRMIIYATYTLVANL